MLSTDVFKLQGASQISVGSQFAQRFTEQVGNNHQSHPSQSVPSITKELVLVLYTPGLCQTEDLGLRTSSASSFRKVQNVLLADQGHWCHFSGLPTPLLYQTHLYGASAPQLINVNHKLFWQFSIYPPEKQFFFCGTVHFPINLLCVKKQLRASKKPSVPLPGHTFSH